MRLDAQGGDFDLRAGSRGTTGVTTSLPGRVHNSFEPLVQTKKVALADVRDIRQCKINGL